MGLAASAGPPSSYVGLVDGTARILVDVGPGAFVRLGESGIEFKSLDTLLLTHLHIDHTGDLASFVKSRDLSLRRRSEKNVAPKHHAADDREHTHGDSSLARAHEAR